MILSWMAYASLCAALCAIAAACVDSVMQHRLRQRRGVWMVAIVASVVLPLAIPFLVAARTVVDPIGAPSAPILTDNLRAQTTQAATITTVDWGALAIAIWILSSAVLAISLFASSARLRRRMRGYRSARVDGQSLLVSDDFGPAVVGLLHTTIVLPAWALTLSDAERRLVLAHEVEHQRASDPALSIAALFVVALFPWNAALWWQLSRLRLAIEFDCDARVVTHNGADPFAYGNLLVTAHENAGHSRVAALALAPMRSALGQRINALVATDSRSLRRTLSTAVIAVFAVSALGFAPVPDVPRLIASSPPRASRTESALTLAPTLHLVEKRTDSIPAGTLTNSTTESRKRPRTVQPKKAGSLTSAPVATEGTYSMAPQSTAVPTLGRITQIDSAASRLSPDSSSYVIRPINAVPSAMSGAVMRQGTIGGGGGTIRRAEVLKSYKGGFMDAEVPARADSSRPKNR